MNKTISGRSGFHLGLYIFIILLTMTLLPTENVSAQDSQLVVRLAKLKIDSAQLENYKAALREEIETSIRVEPGVLTLYAVADNEHPTVITILEIYLDADAYKRHLETPHFKKYKRITGVMVKSLELVETTPVMLGSKLKI